MRYFFLCLAVLLCGCMLGACTPAMHVEATDTQMPHFTWQAPPQQVLMPVKWDFPRLQDAFVVKNSAECLKLGKRGVVYGPGKLPDRCAVPAIDVNSNLYIGLDQVNYQNLVYDYNILINREKRWRFLLKQINKQAKRQNGGH